MSHAVPGVGPLPVGSKSNPAVDVTGLMSRSGSATLVPAMLAFLFALAVGTADIAKADDESPRGRNPRLFVVPAPGAVSIDGRLDDWDRSGGIESYIDPATREQRRIITYAMYDDEALYVAGEVWDDVAPMMNRHDPWVNPETAWDADAFQLRLYLDPQYPGDEDQWEDVVEDHRIVHMVLWYYTDRAEPNVQLRYSMGFIEPPHDWPGGIVPHDAFDAVYRKWDDGAGYTFEYRLPWEVISPDGHRPRGGDVTAANIQVQWSRPDGLRSLSGEGWARDLMRRRGFPWQTSEVWGKAIFAEHGDLPPAARTTPEHADEVVSVEPPRPLNLEVHVPRDGRVSLGLYDQRNVLVRQLLAEEPMDAGTHTLQWNGLDHHGEPLAPDTYTPRGIVSDPIETEFILSVHNAGDPPYKTDDNTGGWGSDHNNPTTVAAAGERMILAWGFAESGWGIIATDLDGKKQWGTRLSAEHLATDGERLFAAGAGGVYRHEAVRVHDLADSRRLNFASGAGVSELPPDGDAQSNRVTGLAYHDGRLYVSLEARDAIAVNDAQTGELLASWSVPAPGRLAVQSDASVIAISDGRLVRVRDGAVAPFAEAHGERIDNPAGVAIDAQNRVYVTNHGALHNVGVFSPDGEYLRSIGKAGGRAAMGRYEPDGMLAPGGCDIDAQGRLWVAETLDAPRRISVWDTQTGELLAEYFGASDYFGWAWMDPQRPHEVYCHNVLWKVDLDERTHEPHSTIWRRTDPDMIPAPNAGGLNGALRVITADNGAQFAWAGAGSGAILYMRDGDIFRPIAGIIEPWRDDYPALKPYMRELEAQWDDEGLAEHRRPRYLFWQDTTDDGRIEPSEVTPWLSNSRGFDWVGSDLSVWNRSGTRLEPVRFDGRRPIYDIDQAIETGFTGGRGTGSIYFENWRDDGVYHLHPGAEHTLAQWTHDRQLRWSIGQWPRWHDSLNKPAMQSGDLWGMTMPLGMAGEFTGAATYFGGYHLFTRDGRYVAMAMRPGGAGGGLGPDITTSETVMGQLVQPVDSDRYFLLAGDQDGRITEIHGLNTVEPVDLEPLTLTETDAQSVVEAQREYEAAERVAVPPFVQRPPSSLDDPHGAVRVRVDDRRAFEAQLAHDRDNLYVHYRAQSPSPLVNDERDPQIIFKGGNLMDVQLATNPAAEADREAPAEGDIRLLIGRRADGEPIAVRFQPRIEGFAGEPIVLESPTGTETFHAIDRIGDVTLDYEQTDAGFTATASIPLSEIGWQPVSGQAVRMDLGYIFGNATGTIPELRAYWHNDSFASHVVDDIPHESRIEPHHWGVGVVE